MMQITSPHELISTFNAWEFHSPALVAHLAGMAAEGVARREAASFLACGATDVITNV